MFTDSVYRMVIVVLALSAGFIGEWDYVVGLLIAERLLASLARLHRETAEITIELHPVEEKVDSAGDDVLVIRFALKGPNMYRMAFAAHEIFTVAVQRVTARSTSELTDDIFMFLFDWMMFNESETRFKANWAKMIPSIEATALLVATALKAHVEKQLAEARQHIEEEMEAQK